MLEGILHRLQIRLKAVNLSESKAATLAGLSDSAIRNIRRAVQDKKAHGVSVNTLAALAPILQTNLAWLVDGVGPEEGDAVEVVRSDVPLISWVSAGELGDQPTVEQLSEYPTVTTYNLPAGEWIALRVDGASMNKISPPDSIIFVNMRDRALVANACYVIADETGKATYKRYRPNETPSFQPASYKDIPAPKLDGVIRIIGRVRRSVIDM